MEECNKAVEDLDLREVLTCSAYHARLEMSMTKNLKALDLVATAGERPGSVWRLQYCRSSVIWSYGLETELQYFMSWSRIIRNSYLSMSAIHPVFILCRPCLQATFFTRPRSILSWPKSSTGIRARRYGSALSRVSRPERRDGLKAHLEEHKVFRRPRRRFSTSAAAMHGHLTPPKPGEE